MGYDPETGRPKRRTVYGRTRQEVAEKKARLIADAKQGLLADPTKETLADYLQRWLETVQKPRVRPNTLAQYETLIRRHIAPALGRLRIDRITPAHLQQLYTDKLAAGLSPSTVRTLHAILHKALGQAVKWGMLPRNPADAVERPRVPRHEFTALTPAQVQALLQAAREDRLYALYVLAVTTGIRLGELLGLTWPDVNLNSGELCVARQLVWVRNTEPTLAGPKTDSGRRTIALPPVAVDALREHRRRQLRERLLAGPAWQDRWNLVFSTPLGTPINPSNLRNRSFRRLLEKAGLPRVRFHDLRHTVATLLLAAGTNVKAVQEQLGHTTARLTLDVYAHTLPGMRQQVAATLSGWSRRLPPTDCSKIAVLAIAKGPYPRRVWPETLATLGFLLWAREDSNLRPLECELSAGYPPSWVIVQAGLDPNFRQVSSGPEEVQSLLAVRRPT